MTQHVQATLNHFESLIFKKFFLLPSYLLEGEIGFQVREVGREFRTQAREWLERVQERTVALGLTRAPRRRRWSGFRLPVHRVGL